MAYDPIADFLSEPRSVAECEAMLRWLARQVDGHGARYVHEGRKFTEAELEPARQYINRVLRRD